ncbi:MAG: energy-dependent translational throttle protein EttA [Lentisphaerae bacterium]|nr:energy-dependent translational throttle protein EttA [Lentisphaerota bacterium]
MAGEYVYSIEHLTKQHGTNTVFEDLTLAFFFGAKIGVIGANGSGKSSLLRIMAGIDKEYSGTVNVAPRARVGYLEQEPQMDLSKTVAEVVAEGVVAQQAKLNRYDELCGKLGESLSPAESEKVNKEMAALQDEIDHLNLWELDHQVEMAMDALRLPPADMLASVLSGGERRRVALCRLLLSNPDVLLLDEPTNHLDADSVAWIEEHLKRFAGTLIVVTHDRYFLSNVTEWILEMDGGRGYPYKGNYEAWLVQKQAMTERQAAVNASRRKLLEQELQWVRLNPAGRQAKNKARLRRYEEMASQEVDTREENLVIQIPHGRRLGDLVVEAVNLSKAYGDRLLMDKVKFSLPRGGIVGIIGGNGAGKTTLFRMITGQEKPTSGELRIGESVDLAYVDQNRDALDANHSVWEEITGGMETIELGGRKMNSRAYCNRFNFKGQEQQKKVGQLSGGERNRVHLAKLLKGGGNLLLLDEPTNDLDVSTLRSLEEGLETFGGCAVVISHDRWFLDRVATHILSFEGDSEVVWFEGNYQAYHEERRKKLGDRADQPHRLRYRPLAR